MLHLYCRLVCVDFLKTVSAGESQQTATVGVHKVWLIIVCGSKTPPWSLSVGRLTWCTRPDHPSHSSQDNTICWTDCWPVLNWAAWETAATQNWGLVTAVPQLRKAVSRRDYTLNIWLLITNPPSVTPHLHHIFHINTCRNWLLAVLVTFSQRVFTCQASLNIWFVKFLKEAVLIVPRVKNYSSLHNTVLEMTTLIYNKVGNYSTDVPKYLMSCLL